MAYADNTKRFPTYANSVDVEVEHAYETVYVEINPDSIDSMSVTIPYAEWDAIVAHVAARRAVAPDA